MPYCSGDGCWSLMPCSLHPVSDEEEGAIKPEAHARDRSRSKSRTKKSRRSRSNENHKQNRKRSRSRDKKHSRQRHSKHDRRSRSKSRTCRTSSTSHRSSSHHQSSSSSSSASSSHKEQALSSSSSSSSSSPPSSPFSMDDSSYSAHRQKPSSKPPKELQGDISFKPQAEPPLTQEPGIIRLDPSPRQEPSSKQESSFGNELHNESEERRKNEIKNVAEPLSSQNSQTESFAIGSLTQQQPSVSAFIHQGASYQTPSTEEPKHESSLTSSNAKRLSPKSHRHSSRHRSKKSKRSRSRGKDLRRKDRKHSRSRDRSRSQRKNSRSRSSRKKASKSRSKSRQNRGRKLAFDPAALNGALSIANSVMNGTANPEAASALLLQQMQSANPQATRQARRLYIGNMPTGAGITESMLLEFFTTTVISLGIMTPQPVLSVWCSSEGTFCFVEFRAIRDATTCLSLLQNITLGGRVLNVGRPADYKAPPSYLENFIVGLSADSISLPAPATNGPVGLLGLKLPLPGMPHIVPVTSSVVPTLALTMTSQPSEVLMLVNMVDEAELADDEDFEDIVLDVREECEKFGQVLEIVIPRPANQNGHRDDGKIAGTNDSGPRVGQGLGRVFARFATSESCIKAKNALDGRMFNNNRVGASSWDVSKFESRIYA